MHHVPSTRRSPRARQLAILFLALTGLFLALTPAQGYFVIFKDGFSIQGRIKKEQTFVGGAAGAWAVPLAGAPYWLETVTSDILFSPSQIYDIMDDPPSTAMVHLHKDGVKTGFPMPPSWTIAFQGPFDAKWQRDVKIGLPNKGVYEDIQRITDLTPKYIRVQALHRFWAAYYHPDEFGPELVKKLMADFFAIPANKDMTKLQKTLSTANFMAQCGWLDEATAVLNDYAKDEPKGQQSKVEKELAFLAKVKANKFVQDLVLADSLGRYQEVEQRLDAYAKEKMDKLVDPEVDLKTFEVKDRLAKKKYRLEVAKQNLHPDASLVAGMSPEVQAFYKQASATIFKEINLDAVDRLETFLEQVEMHKLDLKEKRKPVMTAEQVMSLALTGWLLGKNVAEENVDYAKKLWEAREFVLKYQNTVGEAKRADMRKELSKEVDIDALARLIQKLPPPRPHTKINTDIQHLDFSPFNIGKGQGGSYEIQLPPEYSHNRAYPVLIVLHDVGETPSDMLKKWSKLAAKNGYILVAPSWTAIHHADYRYSDEEHMFMMDLLRDLRAHFQVDSDRVFLFGLGQGALMAYDVGMGHPDQFAGILPMSGYPRFHSWNCRNNGQYLPFYSVIGALDTYSREQTLKLFEYWVAPGRQFPSLMVEYKGRTMEWLPGELPSMMDWMNRKVRMFPREQCGSKDEEFCTMRATDNRFYWLSTKSIVLNPMPKAGPGWNNFWAPAKMDARIFSGNQIYLRGQGLGQISVWLAPGMVDFSKKVEIRWNAGLVGNYKVSPKLDVLLEDFQAQGDRSRLFLDRIDLVLGKN